MSKGYTSNGKRISATTHARRSWTCSCGKVVSGNGGRSSHQRACLVYMREMLSFHERMLAELVSGERRGSEAIVNRHGHEIDVLSERIAERSSKSQARLTGERSGSPTSPPSTSP